MDHLTVGYSLMGKHGTKHRNVVIDLQSLQGIGQGEFELNRLLLDVDTIIREREYELSRVCPVCDGSGEVLESIGEEAVGAPCPRCGGKT